jgi:4-hydroxybenzoate polyprenyltransferase
MVRWCDIFVLCRPWQWVKNAFVLAPLLFSPSAWNARAVYAAVVATLCFCLLSSGVYALNDVLDAETDARHPRKRNRPVAAGRISPPLAIGLAAILTLAAASVAVALLDAPVLLHGGLYLGNNLLYGLVLRRRVLVDVMSVAIGFVLRLLAGCAAIGVPASSWLLVCGFSLAMLLGFGKRRVEIGGLAEPGEYRPTLRSYDIPKLNMLLSITSSVCLLSYMLYTVAASTIALHGTDKLIFTVPFVAYGIFRYIFEVQDSRYDGPVEVFLRDPVFAFNGLLWVVSVVLILRWSSLTGIS